MDSVENTLPESMSAEDAQEHQEIPERPAKRRGRPPKERPPNWKRPRYYAGRARLVALIDQKIDRAVEVAAARKNITKRHFIECALCSALGKPHPDGTEPEEDQPALPPAA